jgi:iron complex outermembrane recepter protein
VHVLHDHHRESNIHPFEEQVRSFRDLTLSGGLEDLISVGERLELELGAGIDARINLQADNYDLQADSIFPFPEHRDVALNLRAGLLYRAGAKSNFSANLSRKNRFPTIKDRYSYRLGRSVPNPDLQAESSWNASMGYSYASSTFRLKPVIFFSHLENTMQAIYGIDPDNSAVYQFRNTGRAIFYGLEAELAWNPVENLESGICYTLTEQKNLTAPEIRFTDVPGHKLDATVIYMPLSRLRFGWNGTYNSSRISTTDGIYRTGPFFITGISLNYLVFKGLSFEGSVRNLLDAAYSYMEGYPSPGRQYFMGLRYRFR